MKKFIERILTRVEKLDLEQIHRLLLQYATENERLNMVLNSLTEGIIVTDSQHGLVVSNKSSQKLLAGGKKEKKGMPVWHYIKDRDISQYIKEVLQEQNNVLEQEFSMDENNIVLSVNILPLVKNGHIHGSLIQVSDVSDKRKKEAQLRRAENLATLTTLAAGVAHEIKNPLGSISIHIQLMQKAMRNKDKINIKYLEKYIQIVHEEVERLNKIIVTFLFSTRPMDMLPIKQNINDIAIEVLGFLKYELKSHNISVQRELQKILPRVMLDERYIKQALINLIKNAISAMEEEGGGTLTVFTRATAESVSIHIQDTGVGISEKVLEKLFNPYFTTKQFGSGLGLSLVYKIVKEHGGDVAIQSSIGVGTCVILSFPLPLQIKRLPANKVSICM